MNIAEQLKQMMENRGISRSKLGREIGVHTSTVSNWLDGKDVKLENLATLCSYFDCSMDYFVGDEAMESVSPEQSTRGMPPEEREAHYRGLHLSEQKEKPAEIGELSEDEIEYIKWFRTQATEKEKEIVRLIVNGNDEETKLW